MEIKTKYNVNDEVWFIHPHSQRAVTGKIKEIQIKVNSEPERKAGERRNIIRTGEYIYKYISCHYSIDDNITKEGIYKSENDLFDTKETLKESLLSKIGNL